MGIERYISYMYIYIYKSWVHVHVHLTSFSLLNVHEILLKKKVRTSCHVDDRYIIMMLFREINKLLVFHMPNFDEKHVGSFSRKIDYTECT